MSDLLEVLLAFDQSLLSNRDLVHQIGLEGFPLECRGKVRGAASNNKLANASFKGLTSITAVFSDILRSLVKCILDYLLTE